MKENERSQLGSSYSCFESECEKYEKALTDYTPGTSSLPIFVFCIQIMPTTNATMQSTDIIINRYQLHDIRFPTSRTLDGSDAMNPDPDYSAAYLILKTNIPHLEGHGLTFTIGRGNDICLHAIEAFMPRLMGTPLRKITDCFGAFWAHLNADSQLRWLGPEKGIIHLALGAVVNTIWDLFAKTSGKPLWRLVAEMTPEQIVACLDFSYLTDVITPTMVSEHLKKMEPTVSKRIDYLVENGYPAYTTSIGWLGYSDEKIRRLCREALADGWQQFKMKVGSNLDDDRRRAAIIRSEIGYDHPLMMDANQKWDVDQAIEWMHALARIPALLDRRTHRPRRYTRPQKKLWKPSPP